MALDLGADVNASNQNGDTALHGAAAHGYAKVIQLLADSGAKLDVKNKRGKTPLAIVKVNLEASPGREELKTAEILLRRLGAKDEGGGLRTP